MTISLKVLSSILAFYCLSYFARLWVKSCSVTIQMETVGRYCRGTFDNVEQGSTSLALTLDAIIGCDRSHDT